MTNVLLNQPDAPAISAWVAIGIMGEYTQPATFKAPVLDLYGEHDFPGVLELAAKRANAIKSVRGSAQIRVAGADHFFYGVDNELVRNVKLFLDRTTR
jgi:alpha/beta superfamily hydrolase